MTVNEFESEQRQLGANKLLLYAILLTLLFLAACQTESADTPTATSVAVAPATDPATPTIASAAAATNTPLPAPVISDSPTAIGEATTAPTQGEATIPAAATEAIEGLIGPVVFDPNVNPLTGTMVSDPASLTRRPIAVKISNYPPIVRPQAGLNSADLIFEHYAEGGVTRFTAVFYSQDATTIGSIRSGRLLDLEIPQMFDSAFAYSGSSQPVQDMIRQSNFFDRVISPDFGHGGFFRVEDPSKPFEHTLFTSTVTLHSILGERGQDVPPIYPKTFAFSQQVLNPATPARTIELQYLATNAFWQFDTATGRYLRWTDGAPHNDANTGAQVNFRNVIVIGANHVDTLILEDFVGGGSYSIEIQMWGEGPVSIFRDGQRIEGRWVRANPGDMITFFDLDGNILPLAPGNSFVQVVPLGFTELYIGQ